MINLDSRISIPVREDSQIFITSDLLSLLSLDYPPHVNSLPDWVVKTVQQVQDGCSGVTRGAYQIPGMERTSFKKFRGTLTTNTSTYHVEVICMVMSGTSVPIILRMWNLRNMACTEYLITSGVYTFHMYLCNREIQSSLISDVLNDILDHADCGFDDTMFKLIPNMNSTWYSSVISAFVFDISTYDDPAYAMNNISACCFMGLGHHELRLVTTQLSGDLPTNRGMILDRYCTVNDGHGISITIDSPAEYFALQQFAMIPYDHYVVNCDVHTGIVEVVELDCMAGVNVPFIGMVPFVDIIQTRILQLVRLCNIPLSKVSIRRTMDEFLEISFITDDGFVSQQRVDLILLSMISPALQVVAN